MQITIRLLTPGDFDTAEEIGQSAFGPSATIGDTIRIAHDTQPDGCLLASVEEKPVGTATVMDYGPFCYIGAMCVREEVQRRGIGRALLARVLEWQEERGISIARLDATDAGARLYRQFGFREIDEVSRFRSVSVPVGGESPSELPGRPEDPVPGPDAPNHESAIRSLEEADITSLLELDRRVFAGSRRSVFGALIHHLPDRAFVSHAGEELTGFIFCQRARIGPWVARDATAAELLLRRALELPFRSPPSLCVPAVNRNARELLEAHGFEATMTHAHMGLGTTEPAGKREMVYSQSSFALG